MISREEKARIARENGAKSRGPVTQEGKDRSRLNSLKHGRYATELEFMVPPHSVLMANEDRRAYFQLFDAKIRHYRPTGDTELEIVRDITDARWTILRAKSLETAMFNRELVRQYDAVDPDIDPQLANVENSIAAVEALAGNRALADLRRQAAQNQRLIAQLEKRLADLRKRFPATGHQPANSDLDKEQHLFELEPEPEQPEAGEEPEEPGTREAPELSGGSDTPDTTGAPVTSAQQPERTNPVPPQPVENTAIQSNPPQQYFCYEDYDTRIG